MTHSDIIYCILGIFLVSYIPRVLPPFILSKRKLSPFIERWLRYVPTAVFGALIFSEIFIEGEQLNFSLNNISFLASVVVFLVAIKTKSLGKCVATGMFVFWVLEKNLC